MTDLAERIVEAAALEIRARYTRGVLDEREVARAALAAAAKEAGLDAEDVRDAASILTGAVRALRSKDESDAYLAAAGIERTAAFLRALAEVAE